MSKKNIVYGILILCGALSLEAKDLPFSKVVLWGHKLHSHTHSYIHYAFHKAFKSLGYDTYWFDANDDVRNVDFSNSLFITEGQVDRNIPLRDDCRYILHNCDQAKYKPLFEKKNCMILQVYTHDVLSRDVTKIEDCLYIENNAPVLYMPWATDLLPDEIDAIKKTIPTIKREHKIYFVGSYMGGGFDNRAQYDALNRACQELGVSFEQVRNVSAEENIDLIQRSFIAPTLQGKWQCDVGYIPCRIFKNISYGQPGITNSKTVYELFNKKIVYNSDPYQLVYDAKKQSDTMLLDDLYEQMNFVRDHHTYLNRISRLLDFLHSIKPLENYVPNVALS